MPRFYGVTNNDAPEDQPKNYAEIHAITHYLFAKSTPPAGFVDPPAKTDPAQGQGAVPPEGLPGLPPAPALRSRPRSSSPTATTSTRTTSPTPPRPVRPERLPRVGPRSTPWPTSARTSRTSPPSSSRKTQGYKWLANWIQAPEAYHPKSLMPNLQLSLAGRGRHRRAGSSRSRASGRSRSTVPGVDSRGGQGGGSTSWSSSTSRKAAASSTRRQVDRRAAQRGRRLRRQEAVAGREADVPGREDDLAGSAASAATRSRASRTPSRSARRSTTGASRARRSSTTATSPSTSTTSRPTSEGDRDGTDLYYQEKLDEHTRIGLPLPEAAPAAQLRLPEEERGPQDVGRPAADAPVRLGQRPEGGRGGDDLRPRPDRREDRRQVPAQDALHAGPDGGGRGGEAPEPVQLHRLPRPGDAQVHDRRGTQARRGVHRLQGQPPGRPTTAGRPTTSTSSIPA